MRFAAALLITTLAAPAAFAAAADDDEQTLRRLSVEWGGRDRQVQERLALAGGATLGALVVGAAWLIARLRRRVRT